MCVRVLFNKSHIIAQSGPVILVILVNSMPIALILPRGDQRYLRVCVRMRGCVFLMEDTLLEIEWNSANGGEFFSSFFS